MFKGFIQWWDNKRKIRKMKKRIKIDSEFARKVKEIRKAFGVE